MSDEPLHLSGFNVLITHKPLGLRAKLVWYMQRISTTRYTHITIIIVTSVAQIHWYVDTRKIKKLNQLTNS